MGVKKSASGSVLKKTFKYLITAFVAMVVFLVFYCGTVIANAPPIDTDKLYSYLPEGSILYDDKGQQIDMVFVDGGNRINITYAEMPKDLVNAVVAIEDKTFWKHHGFNIIRIFGAIRDSIFSGGGVSGTSTVTQQLARNVYLSETKSVRSLNRKVTEAWYTVILERNLTKEQIMEAYLNTIYLGNNSYGIESAARSYFNKSAKDMDLIECASIAAIPKSPDNFSLVRTIDNNTVSDEAIDLNQKLVLSRSPGFTTVYNGDASKDRRETALELMVEQGYISKEQCDAAISDDLSAHMNLAGQSNRGDSVYFSDYTVKQVIKDLVAAGYSEENARNMVYTGGLQIYTTQNTSAQRAIEEAFSDPYNFPSIDYKDTRFDGNNNIISKEGALLLYSYDTYLSGGVFTFHDGEISTDANGNIVLMAGHRLNFYKTTVRGETDYSVEFKKMYLRESGAFYTIENGTLTIPKQYKSLDGDGNLVISAQFLTDHPEYFTVTNGVYSIDDTKYTLNQKVRQPQGAMVICDNKTGAIVAMVGGRDIVGQMLYNRANSPRQPGSSIKPLAVYSAALEQSAEAAAAGKEMEFKNYDKNQKTEGYGSYWTAASKINDAELIINGKVWPRNAYAGYKGILTFRVSLEQSVNVNAVRIFQQVGPEYSSELLKKFGITSLVTEGNTNDMNAAALALGGMTKGISPLEMASAYTTFPNQGVHNSPTCYTEVKNKKGEVLLTAKPTSTKVLDPGVAFIMQDILRTSVSSGIAGAANTGNQVTAGKTGTTSDNYDAWFCGFTPQYSAALWIGSDTNLELTEGSAVSARLWSKIMSKATSGMSGSLPEAPSNIITVNGEYFVKGTEKGISNLANEPEKVNVETCADSGYIASPWCTNRKTVEMSEDDPKAKYYCPIHNKDVTKYPIEPGQTVPNSTTPTTTPVTTQPPSNNNNNVEDDHDGRTTRRQIPTGFLIHLAEELSKEVA